MKKLNSLCEYVFQNKSWATKSNTEAVIAVLEEIALRRDLSLDSWDNVKDILRTKKCSPEYITRQRRYFCQSTKEQQEKADEFRQTYSTSWGL